MNITIRELQLIENLSNTPIKVSFDVDTCSLNIEPNPDIFIPINQVCSDYVFNTIDEVFQKCFWPDRIKRLVEKYERMAVTPQMIRDISHLINVSDQGGLHNWQNTFKKEVKKRLNINT